MPSADNAVLQYEAGQDVTVMSTLTDSGDHKTFTSGADLWSARSGYAPAVHPDGLETGGAVTPAAAAGNNTVDVAALTCYLAGVLTTVAADTDVAITRPATAVSKVNSITVDDSGDVVVVPGTDGSTTAFSETRGGAGGPPLIPVGSIEIAQVRVADDTAAPIAASEIYAVPGVHQERARTPGYEQDNATGSITFFSALPASHTGPVAKGVYASYAEPIFVDVSLASDFVPAETSHSVSSTQIYGGTIGSSSSSLAQGKFTAHLNNGVTDALITLKNETLWFKFFPDKYETPYLLTQGVLGFVRSFKAGESIKADFTISAASQSIEKAS